MLRFLPIGNSIMLLGYIRSTGLLHVYHCGPLTGGDLARTREYQWPSHCDEIVAVHNKVFVRQGGRAVIWSFTNAGEVRPLAEFRRSSWRWPLIRAFRQQDRGEASILLYDPASGNAELCGISDGGSTRLISSAQLGRNWDLVEPGIWETNRSQHAGIFTVRRATGEAGFFLIDPLKGIGAGPTTRLNFGKNWTNAIGVQFGATQASRLLMWDGGSGEIRIGRFEGNGTFQFHLVCPSSFPKTTRSLHRLPRLETCTNSTADGLCLYDQKQKTLSVYGTWSRQQTMQFQLITRRRSVPDYDIICAAPPI